MSFAWDQDTGNLSVYVDGEAEYSSTISISELPSNGTIVLGQEQDNVGGGFDSGQIFEGQIAEVRIYDEALSDEAIADNAAGDVQQEGLVTNWQMDEAVDNLVTDLVGDNDLTLQNEASLVSEPEAAGETIVGTASDDVLSGTTGDDQVFVTDRIYRYNDRQRRNSVGIDLVPVNGGRSARVVRELLTG